MSHDALALAFRSGLPYVGLRNHEPDPEVDRIVPPEAAAAAGVVALTASDEHVRFAAADPEVNLSSLAPYLGNRRVELAITPRAELEAIVGATPAPAAEPPPAGQETLLPVEGLEPVAEEPLAPAEPLPVAGPLAAAEPPVTSEPVTEEEPLAAVEPVAPDEPPADAEPLDPGEPPAAAEPVAPEEPLAAVEPVAPEGRLRPRSRSLGTSRWPRGQPPLRSQSPRRSLSRPRSPSLRATRPPSSSRPRPQSPSLPGAARGRGAGHSG